MADILVASRDNPAVQGLPSPWKHADEWYEWVENPTTNGDIQILLNVDEASYGRGTSIHPIAWCHEYQGGRSFYTALGHTEESYAETAFREHLARGIEWTAARRMSPKSKNNKDRGP